MRVHLSKSGKINNFWTSFIFFKVTSMQFLIKAFSTHDKYLVFANIMFGQLYLLMHQNNLST